MPRIVCAAPLAALVEAQGQASLATLDFMKSLAFDEENRAKVVSFEYNQTEEGTNSSKVQELAVPVLNVLSIPYIEVRVPLRRF